MCDDENHYSYALENSIWKTGCPWIPWKLLEYDRFIITPLEIDNV